MTAETASEKKPKGFWRGVGVFFASFVLGVLGVGIGIAGFAVSFGTLTNIAKPVLPAGDIPKTDIPWAALLPGTIDGTILFLSAMRIIQAIRGKRSPVIETLEYAFIGVTIILNATEGETLRDRAIHAAFPAIYVVVVAVGTMVLLGKFETIREKVKADRIGFARWVLAPVDTFSLWRNMTIAKTKSFRVAIQLEEYKIQRYQEWRDKSGAWWWLPGRAKSVSRADRKALRIEMAKLALGIPGNVPTGIPTGPAAVPVPRPRPVPDVPAAIPMASPVLPRPVPAPSPTAVPAPSPNPVPVTTTRPLVPPPVGEIGEIPYKDLTKEQKADADAGMIVALAGGAKQADVARLWKASTSQVNRLAKRNDAQPLTRVNGSGGSHD